MKILSILATILVSVLSANSLVADDGETVELRGEKFRVWPTENLIARGLSIREVPREQNAAWTYIEAINSFEELPKELEDGFDYALRDAWPESCTPLADYLKLPGNQSAIERAHKAAAMDRCQMPYFGDPKDSIIGVLLPNLSHFRFLGKLMVVDGRRLEAEGNYAEAMRNYLTAMGMGEHVAQGHTLIEGLVGLAVWAAGNRATDDMVLRRPLSVKQLRTLEKELGRRVSRLPTAERGLRGEREFGPAMVDELSSRPLRLFGNLSALTGPSEAWDIMAPDPNSNPADGWGQLERRIGRMVFPDRAIKRHMLGFYDLVLDRAAVGTHQSAQLEFDEEKYINEKIPAWDVVSRMLLPSLSRATLLGERNETRFAATRAIVAIRIHALTHDHEPPDDISKLAENLPDGALIDPFSGDLLLYRRMGIEWILYSVGPDYVDDGGQEGKRWEDLDMVWRYPPEPVEPFEDEKTED